MPHFPQYQLKTNLQMKVHFYESGLWGFAIRELAMIAHHQKSSEHLLNNRILNDFLSNTAHW